MESPALLAPAATETSRTLIQPGPAKAFQIVFTIALLLERNVLCHPGERNIGLGAAKVVQCACGRLAVR